MRGACFEAGVCIPLGVMKTLTTQEFFGTPAVAKELSVGETVLVTDDGKNCLVVTRVVKPPRKTLEQIEEEARMVSPCAEPKVNFTEAIRELNGR